MAEQLYISAVLWHENVHNSMRTKGNKSGLVLHKQNAYVEKSLKSKMLYRQFIIGIKTTLLLLHLFQIIFEFLPTLTFLLIWSLPIWLYFPLTPARFSFKEKSKQGLQFTSFRSANLKLVATNRKTLWISALIRTTH